MSHEEPSAPVATESSRRPSRQGSGGAPLGSTISIVLAVVAVIVGFLILNNITDDGGSIDIDVAVPTDSIPDNTTDTATTTPTSTTEPPLVFDGASVVVANASGVGGSAGRMTTELATAGFTTVEPAINSTLELEASIVQFDPGVAAAQQVAESVARLMGGLLVEPLSTPPAVVDGTIGDAGVLVLLGTDESDRTIAQLSAPIAEVAPAGGDTTDTTDTTTG